MENDELLKKLSENSKKSLMFHRICAYCMVGIFLVVGISAYMIVPTAVTTVNKINDVAIAAEDTLSNTNDLIAEMDKTAKELQGIGDNMNNLINENSEAITDSLDKMSKVDFDGLNKAIQDLQDAVGPFANFMNKFR
ncbi:hypothetical protein [Butyrivibrio sp. VCD2006]|uniref:hypothetical protein n=1 Tax=Butyrivibrio sp. VCD2006 TaxID=1280664 RepID=UPI000415ADC2|nr:hypothetical protein [Butyrivibrio sp. VCD2006]